jgi:hypothetical protein
MHSIKDKGWTPLYYCPANGKVISADDVSRFFKEKGRRWVAGEDKDVPSQHTAHIQDYCNIIHLIDKWNGAEALGRKSRSPLVAEVDLLAVQHGTEQRLQNVQGACQTAHARAEILGHGRRREGIDTRPMSKGSGNEEAKGGASELDAGHDEIVRLDHQLECLLGGKGDDDGAIGDAASAGAGGG